MLRPTPDPISEGQESVWDYPRPPKLERVDKLLKIEWQGELIAETTDGYRVLETSHPPVYYFPPDSVRYVENAMGASFCEWKGNASYVDVVLNGSVLEKVGWFYSTPTAQFAEIADFIAFYCDPFDACWVGDEQATPQPGGFYGGWVTSDIVGPFKGVPGSFGW